MKIGIIGAGGIGQAFAKHAALAGYEVIISNSRGPESLAEIVKSLGSNVTAVTIEEAADADVVFLSVPWLALEGIGAGRDSWAGKTVIDANNAFLPGFKVADLGGKMSSEVVAGWFPGAAVVKAFNTLAQPLLNSEPREAGGNRVIFYSGNDDAAKKLVAEIIEKIGFAGIDLGKLDEGGKLQAFPGGALSLLNLIKL
ncbi:hypothetical protein DYBT9275_02175 [Dyadobacter sp. CECT 9275]|uniref:Pyrroline-5-carboxylate reductase catalytic N-terminal domain-containing protein n=1 Tax=Dyadobacter helix TaxID=2822344 RepID=A0A916JAU5_9BACT|nr:NAD(P)-binding domain-containing protein [Dyadobacter sp. CECT 9275]CAG4999196.1 hypothetical protein DYBT9275_02175 [Dyadobacter sp. CECT 9275]